MLKSGKTPKTIDEFIRNSRKEIQPLLRELRTAVNEAAPNATEIISYGMPAFKQHRNLVYFAPAKHHIGFYPGAAAVAKFLPKLKAYKTSKGAIRFPLDKPLPLKLVKEITAFRVREDAKKAK